MYVKLRHAAFLAVLLLLSGVHGALAQEGIVGGVSRRGVDAVKLAIPEFKSFSPSDKANRLTQVFNEVLWSDLEFSGNIELASRSFYPAGNFAVPSDIKPDDWMKPGIEAAYVAFGTTTLMGTQFRVEAQLMDLKSQQRVIASGYPGLDTEDSARLIAHTFADAILQQLGFGKGISKTQIAFVSSRLGNNTKEIFVMDYDGNNQRRLTAIGSLAITPNWSQDGQRIAYTTWRSGQPNIEITSASGQRQRFEQQTGVTNTTPAWSPDGRQLAFSTKSGDNGGFDIYVADASGAQPRRLTNSPRIDTSPSWNPATGRQIAFVSDRSGSPQIYTMEADGSSVMRLIDGGGDAENPAWSPDGTMIAFAWQKPRTGNFDIYIHHLATGMNIQLTQNAGNNERPTWAPDGKHLAFQSNRTGTNQIYSMLLDGRKVRQLTTAAGINEGPSWSGYVQ